MTRHALRRKLIGWAVVAAAVVVVVLVVLVGTGILRLPTSSSSAGTLTVTEVQWTILQGTINSSSNVGWFGPSHLNYTLAEGFPLQTAAGGTFTVALIVSDLGNQAHTVYTAVAGTPFSVVSSHPTLPVLVPAGEDDASFNFTIHTPSTPGVSLVLLITVSAFPP